MVMSPALSNLPGLDPLETSDQGLDPPMVRKKTGRRHHLLMIPNSQTLGMDHGVVVL